MCMLGHRNGIAQIHRTATLADVIAIPARDLDHDVAAHHALAAKAGIQCEIRRLIEAVRFIVFHLVDVRRTLQNLDVTRGAGANAATGVLQLDAIVQGHVEHGVLQAMFRIRHGGGVELNGDVLWKKCNLRQAKPFRWISGRRSRLRAASLYCHPVG